jgi:hypothetical protein
MIAMLQDLRQHQSTERAARIDDLLASVSCTHNSTELLTDCHRLLMMLLTPLPPFKIQQTDIVDDFLKTSEVKPM